MGQLKEESHQQSYKPGNHENYNNVHFGKIRYNSRMTLMELTNSIFIRLKPGAQERINAAIHLELMVIGPANFNFLKEHITKLSSKHLSLKP